MSGEEDNAPPLPNNQKLKFSVLLLVLIVTASLFLVIPYFSRTVSKLESNVAEIGGENFQLPEWFLEWLNSNEGFDEESQKLNITCKKIKEGNQVQGWKLRCMGMQEDQPYGTGKQPQLLNLVLHKPDGKDNEPPQPGNSLCCHPCSHPVSPPPPPPPPIPLPPPPPTPTPTPPPPPPSPCQHQSVTLSTEFEMEMKMMLEAELRRQLQQVEYHKMSERCQNEFQNDFQNELFAKFETTLKSAFTTGVHQISVEKETNSDTFAVISREIISQEELLEIQTTTKMSESELIVVEKREEATTSPL